MYHTPKKAVRELLKKNTEYFPYRNHHQCLLQSVVSSPLLIGNCQYNIKNNNNRGDSINEECPKQPFMVEGFLREQVHSWTQLYNQQSQRRHSTDTETGCFVSSAPDAMI